LDDGEILPLIEGLDVNLIVDVTICEFDRSRLQTLHHMEIGYDHARGVDDEA